MEKHWKWSPLEWKKIQQMDKYSKSKYPTLDPVNLNIWWDTHFQTNLNKFYFIHVFPFPIYTDWIFWISSYWIICTVQEKNEAPTTNSLQSTHFQFHLGHSQFEFHWITISLYLINEWAAYMHACISIWLFKNRALKFWKCEPKYSNQLTTIRSTMNIEYCLLT